MQVSIETTSGLERRLTISVPAARVDQAAEERLKKAAKTVRLNGFRPGKVPMKVVKQRFGEGVRQEVIGEVVNQTFYEAIVQEKINPAGAPSIEPKQFAAGKDLEYVATFEVYPEVKLVELDGVEIEKPKASVKAADVKKMIDIFRKQQATWKVAKRAAKKDDRVNIDFVGTKDGEEFAGGSAKGSDLVLGSGQMIPGFEDGIIGMKKGEEKTIDVTFPEDYHSEELKGAAVQFTITVNSVEAQSLPKLDEEFFAKYGVEEGGEDVFKEEVRNNMERELKNAIKQRVKTAVLDKVIEAHSAVQVPKALITSEIQGLKRQALQQYGMGGQDFDLNMLPDDMFKDQAERRVKLGLILSEVVKAKELKADADKVREMVEEIASTYQEPKEVVDYYYSNQEQLQGIESAVLEDQVVEILLEKAKVVETASDYESVLNPAAQQA
jgi:trigger factor